jgi:Phage integrase family
VLPAGLEIKAHPHMLRHACGYALANKGHDTRAIQGWLGPPVDYQHGRLHGAGAEPVQGLLKGVIVRKGTTLAIRRLGCRRMLNRARW